MTDTIGVRDLFDQLHDRLGLSWAAGPRGKDCRLRIDDLQQGTIAFVGYLNVIHPNRIQVLGRHELEYLETLGHNSYQDIINQLFTPGVCSLVIIADGQDVPEAFLRHAENSKTPVLTTATSSQAVVDQIQYHLDGLLAGSVILHGMFMEVMGTGVLIAGESSIGKSELALELITRGHRLIADDTPEFTRVAPDTISGTCPPLLRDFLEVRGLGVLNIRAMYGDSATKNSKFLRLIIQLTLMDSEQLQRMDRLQGERRLRKVLGVDIPEITVPVAPGRNLAVLVEAAVRNHNLTLLGMDAGRDFIERHQRLLDQATS